MLKEIREHFGIPQDVFADHLGVTRSKLSMAESNKRHLNGVVMEELLPLFKAIEQKEAKHSDEMLGKELDLQKEEMAKMCHKKLKDNEFKLLLCEKQLSKMQNDQTRCTQILQNLSSIKAKTKGTHNNLLLIIENNARILQKKTAAHCQLNLELKIHHLKNENAFLQKRIS